MKGERTIAGFETVEQLSGKSEFGFIAHISINFVYIQDLNTNNFLSPTYIPKMYQKKRPEIFCFIIWDRKDLTMT